MFQSTDHSTEIKTSDLSHRTAKQGRLVVSFAWLSFIAFGLVHNYYYPDVYDPISWRFGIGGAYLLMILISFSHQDFFLRNLQKFYAVIVYSASSYVAWSVYNSNNHPSWVLGWVMTVFMCQIIQESFKAMIAFMIYTLLLAVAFNLQPDTSLTPIPLIFTVLISTLILNYLLIQHRVKMILNLKMQKAQLIKQAEELDLQRANTFHASKLASLGEIAGGIAHEINNPLAIIQGQAAKIKRNFSSKIAEPDLSLICDKIEANVQRISKIVKGVREFSSESSNELPKIIRLNIVVENALGLIQEKIKSDDIQLRVNLDLTSEAHIRCRPYDISRVLINLLINAHDAVKSHRTTEDWIAITSQLESDSCMVSISNSGPAIHHNIRDKIFQPFFTTKEVGKGIGLGLSIAKGTLLAHDADLILDPNSEHTRFIATFKVHNLSRQ